MLLDPEKRKNFSVPAFLERHSKDKRWPQVKANAQALKSQYPKLGAIGYCYGGWACFRLGADPSLVDAIATAHPSLMVKEEIEALKVPVQIVAPENDTQLTLEMKEYVNRVVPSLNLQYEYIYFPGLSHGFAVRGDPNDKVQKEGLERAKTCAVNFFNQFLH
jgi:dienelactone hydrolase